MARGTCGKNLTWTFDNGTLTISGNIYVSADSPWCRYRESITKVVIKDGVTTIGNWAFSECNNLTSVVIPDSVTTIGAYAFYACKSLTSVVIPGSIKAIGGVAFYACKSLTSVVIPDSVTTIDGWAFSGCESLTRIVIPNSVTTIGENAFSWCCNLTSIEIPSSVKAIGKEAFSECWNLTSVVIPGTVKTIGVGVFASCTALEKIYYKGSLKIDLKSLTVGNNAKLIPYDEFPPAETNCNVYRNTTISRAKNIAPPNTKSWSRVDENIAEIRRAAELAAMNIVMTIERDLGFSPEDVSSQNLGYDIKSTSRDGKTLRLIEVKGRRIDAETVTVSRNEIAAALNNPDNFILAIVRLDGDKNETIYIRKPFEHPPDRAAFSVNFSIQELVEFKSN